MQYPLSIQNLIKEFMKLPTVGPKTAERFVFYLLQQNPEELQKFAQAIAELKEKITICQSCFAVAESSSCEICRDQRRDHTLICVVENTRDMLAMEKIKEYNGYYHILGGVINSLNNVQPENLKIKELITKIKNQKIKEIILAFNSNFEGETTSLYITKQLKPYQVKITRLAKGLPMGSDLEYADDITLANALKYRNEI